MKISKKEKNLLLTVVLIIVALLFYFYIYKPQSNKLVQLKEEVYQKQMMLTMKQEKVKNIGEMELQLKKAKEQILPLAETYFGKVDQEEFIVLLNNLSENSNIHFSKLEFKEGFKDMQDGEVLTPKTKEEESQNSAPPEQTSSTAETANNSTAENPNQATPLSAEEDFYKQQFGNIELLLATADFKGTYEEMTKMINLMDLNPENIVSSSFEWKKPDLEVRGTSKDNLEKNKSTVDSIIEGKILLQFYRVPNIDKYKVEEPSTLETPMVPKSTKPNPVISYPWAWKVVSVAKPSGSVMPGLPGSTVPTPAIPGWPGNIGSKDGMTPYFPSIANVPVVADRPKVRQPESTVAVVPIINPAPAELKPELKEAVVLPSTEPEKEPEKKPEKKKEESIDLSRYDSFDLFKFENLKDYEVTSGNAKSSAQVTFTKAYAKPNPVLSLAYHVDSSSEDAIRLDFKDENIEIKKRPDFFTLSMYAYENTDHSVWLEVEDAQEKQYQILVCEEIDWSEWADIRTAKIPKMEYPVKLKGLSIGNKKNSPKMSSVLLFETISIEYKVR